MIASAVLPKAYKIWCPLIALLACFFYYLKPIGPFVVDRDALEFAIHFDNPFQRAAYWILLLSNLAIGIVPFVRRTTVFYALLPALLISTALYFWYLYLTLNGLSLSLYRLYIDPGYSTLTGSAGREHDRFARITMTKVTYAYLPNGTFIVVSLYVYIKSWLYIATLWKGR